MKPTEARLIVMTLLSGYQSQTARLPVEDMQLMIETYRIGLEDLSVEDARAAVARAMRTSKWLPTIAEIRALVVGARTGDRTGAEAWTDVIKAVSRRGIYRTPGVDFTFADPITASLVTAQGWREICNGDGDNVRADRARVIDAYDRIRVANKTNAAANTGAKILPMHSRIEGTISIADGIKGGLDTGKFSDDDIK